MEKNPNPVKDQHVCQDDGLRQLQDGGCYKKLEENCLKAYLGSFNTTIHKTWKKVRQVFNIRFCTKQTNSI